MPILPRAFRKVSFAGHKIFDRAFALEVDRLKVEALAVTSVADRQDILRRAILLEGANDFCKKKLFRLWRLRRISQSGQQILVAFEFYGYRFLGVIEETAAALRGTLIFLDPVATDSSIQQTVNRYAASQSA